ncbi:MAG: inorganic triphosphatase [Aestuariibacter sp.]
MESEIELKLLVASNAEKVLNKRFIPQLKADCQQQTSQLYNSYFDTDDQQLRQHGMGLRVRGENGQFEQTIKSGDGSVGGLHKRTEVNVTIPTSELQLDAFPREIWPDDLSPDDVEAQLGELFTTQFQRTSYLLTLEDQSKVEMVFDSGEIATQKHHENLSEIELELKEGDPQSLFQIANELLPLLPFRLGYKSKAQRGYELWNGEEQAEPHIALPFPLTKELSLTDAFTQLLSYNLENWQYHEQRYAESHKVKDLVGMYAAIELVGMTLDLFTPKLQIDGLADITHAFAGVRQAWHWVSELGVIKELTSKKGLYSKRIVKNPEVMKVLMSRQKTLLDQHTPKKQIRHQDYVKVQLALLEMLVLRPWKDVATQVQQDNNVAKFARKTIRQHLTTLSKAFEFDQTAGCQMYLHQLPGLISAKQVQQLLGNVAGSKTRNLMHTWLDIQDGVAELQLLDVLEQKLRLLDANDREDLLEWCLEKQQSLVQILELSRQSVLSTQLD